MGERKKRIENIERKKIGSEREREREKGRKNNFAGVSHRN